MRSASERHPQISVLMPCYNGERWISEAIESVLRQTCDDFELVLVDDGSTDSTLDVIRGYAEREPRINLIMKPHSDVSHTLNMGLATATGRWVARLDQDDVCEPTRLARQLAFVKAHPDVVFVGSPYIRVDESGRVVATHGFPLTHDRLMINLERVKGFCPHSTGFFRRDIALDVGGYRSALNQANDHDLWLRMAARGKIASLEAPTVRCRGHSRQMSHDGGGEPQLVATVAATVCHFIRMAGGKDPLDTRDPSLEAEFLESIRNGVRRSGLMERRQMWLLARAEYFKRSNRITGFLGFLHRLLRSGNATKLCREKVFGLSLPEELAAMWIRQNGGPRRTIV